MAGALRIGTKNFDRVVSPLGNSLCVHRTLGKGFRYGHEKFADSTCSVRNLERYGHIRGCVL
ncbi:hypothetical protein CBM2618_B50003 [Cupriavidus taiwanensis]|nr:hypothetical protein CBM2618_B50003 [Cupriavidus taiwanensis]